MATMKKPTPKRTLKAVVTTESQTRMTGSMNKPDLRTRGGGNVKVTQGKTATKVTPATKQSIAQMQKGPMHPPKPLPKKPVQNKSIAGTTKKPKPAGAKMIGR